MRSLHSRDEKVFQPTPSFVLLLVELRWSGSVATYVIRHKISAVSDYDRRSGTSLMSVDAFV